MRRLLKLTLALAATGGTFATAAAVAVPSAAGPAADTIRSTAARIGVPANTQALPQVPEAIAPYCVNTYTSNVEPITLVKINEINNTSAGATGGTAHEDFTAVVGTLRPGATYAITMKANTDGAFSHGNALYVDWNQNGVFTDANEGYWIGTITGSTGTDALSVTALITVPADAVLGNTRLRAMTAYDTVDLSELPPCRTGAGYGQSEDYTVTVDTNAVVPALPLSVSASFTPAAAAVPTSTTLAIAVGNINTAATPTTADFTTTLPAGMTLAANATTTCPGTLTGSSGDSAITLASGAAIPPGGCTISANVAVSAAGNYAVTAGPITTAEGNASAVAKFFGWNFTQSTSYDVGFEAPDYTVAAINGQQGWSARGSNVATTVPANGTQHFSQNSAASPNTSNNALAISPQFPVGTTRYVAVSANLRMTHTTNGASWYFQPQDPDASLVTTYVRFNRTGNSIDSILWSGGTGTFTPTGATFTPGTYFNLKLLVDRATSNVRICKDGVQIFETTDGSGTTGGNNVSNMVFQQVTGSGQTANNTFFADDLNVTYTPSYNCDGSLPQHTVTSSIGTPAGSISPLGAQSVNEGDSIAFTLTPDAGFHIDTVGGTCAGSLAGDTYTVSNVLADCDVVANFAADIVTHTVTAVVGTGSGTITPPSAVVNDGDTTAFTVTADAGSHIDTVTGCGGTLAGNTYTTGAITSDCTVTANFAVNTTPQPAFFNGALTTSSPTFANPGGSTSGTGVQYYCAQEFTVDTSGSYTLESTSPNTTGTPSSALDTYLRLYANTFNPGSPGAGQASNDDFTGTLTVLPGPYAGTVTATATGFQGTQPGSRITSTLTAGTTYYLVNTSFRSTNYVPTAGEGRPTGPYYTGIGGPGTVTLVGTTCSATTVTHTVTAVVGTGTGTITPPSAVVNEGDTTAFTVTAGSGFHIDTVTGCSGTLAGNTYTTGPVTADCTVTANFAADGANPPSATVTPNSLSFTVREDETGSQTLNIANAAGSNMLTFAITGQASRPARLVPYMTKDRHAHAMLRSTGMRLVRAGGAAHASPAPWSPMGPDGSVTFQADDGSYETSVAWTDAAGTTQNTSLWLNRYTATGALTIDTVSIEWPNAASANGNVTGKTVNVVAYYDADGDGDPSNAVRLGGNTPVTINGPDVFENYPTNFAVPGAGDVYLGFVDTFAAGGTTPVLYSAALDESGNPNLGWVAAMSTGDADVDVLGNNDNIGTLDGLSLGALSGVWMVRGTTTSGGATCAGAAVAWLSASPANGLVAGGANTNVTITANPSADGLAPGSYTAMLCVATNDPAHALIGVPVALTVTPAPVVPCSAADTIFCDGFDPAAGPFTQPIQDPSFEETTDDAGVNPEWESLDGNPDADGGTTFYSEENFDIPTHSGGFAAWFGGWGGGVETQHFAQSVPLPDGGPLYLNYWRFVVDGPDVPSNLVVSVDGVAVQTTDLSTQLDDDYVLQSIDISAYADGGSHVIRFEYHYDDTGSTDGDTLIDDVTIDRTPTPIAH